MPDSLITDEVRVLIGQESPPERNRFPISAEMSSDVADAIEDPNPLYVDPAYARKSRFAGLLCPPLATWKDITPPIGYFGAGQESHFQVPLPFNSYGLNGGSDWQFLRPAYVDTWVTRQFRVLDIFEKQGRSGPLVFVVRQETQTNQHGQAISVAKRVSIHRALASDQQEGPAAQLKDQLQTVPVAPPEPEVIVPKPQPAPREQLYFEDVGEGQDLPRVTKGPITTTHLVRWAAANGNYARIHWDLPFAQLHQGLAQCGGQRFPQKSVLGTVGYRFCRGGGLVKAVLRAASRHGLSRGCIDGIRHRYRKAGAGRLRSGGLYRGAEQQPGGADSVGHRHGVAPEARPEPAAGVGGGPLVAPGILNGVRVLELGGRVSSPFCAKLLADYGADVVKVEPPQGDRERHTGPFAGDIPHPERSVPFLYLNTNKRAVTLDIECDTGRDILNRLLRETYVVVENFPPEKSGALGLDYASLSEGNPGVVATSITPFGRSGPYRNFAATDIVVFALSGLMYHSGDSDREPLRNALRQSFYVGGANAAMATLVALFQRLTSGVGQQVEVSLVECLATHLVQAVPYYNFSGAVKGRRPVRGSGFEELMPARDGYVIPSVQGSQLWSVVADLIGAPGLGDEKFATGSGRIENGEELKRLLEEGLSEWDRKPLFQASGERRLVFGMAQDAGDLFDCPHLLARDFFVEVDHPVAGKARYPGMGPRLLPSGFEPGPAEDGANMPFEIRRPAPTLGQHNAEILGDELGISPQDLGQLRALGVI